MLPQQVTCILYPSKPKQTYYATRCNVPHVCQIAVFLGLWNKGIAIVYVGKTQNTYPFFLWGGPKFEFMQ
jgi:hypothetical protein